METPERSRAALSATQGHETPVSRPQRLDTASSVVYARRSAPGAASAAEQREQVQAAAAAAGAEVVERWALYARSGGRTLTSGAVEQQLARLRDLVAARGGQVVGEFCDVATPAGEGAGLRGLLDLVEAGGCDRVAGVELPRLLRGIELGGELVAALRRARVGLTVADRGGEGGYDVDLASLVLMLPPPPQKAAADN